MLKRRHQRPEIVPPAARFVGGVFGFVFFGIGLTVLVFLWAAPFEDFGSPPLFFRVVGSFIAVAFIALGGTTCAGSILGNRIWGPQMPQIDERSSDQAQDEPPPLPPATTAGYRCPHCGAPLAKGADVSPHGDVKCTYCNCWFNVHSR